MAFAGMPHPFSRAALRVIVAMLAALAPAAANAAPPRRIVSLNLCADQFLLALADPGQIAGLTRNAVDPELSAAAAKAKGFHILGNSAEEIIAIDPDLILGTPGRRSGPIAGRDPAILDLPPAESYGAILAQIRQVAAAVGHPARGAALIAQMDRALARLPRAPDGRVAAYYQRRGYLTGTGTLMDELMARAGLVNLAGRLGKPALSQLSLEELIAARPDYLIVESATARVMDQGTEMLHHPILAAIPRLILPQAWTVCGGPAYVLAARSLAAQLRAKGH